VTRHVVVIGEGRFMRHDYALPSSEGDRLVEGTVVLRRAWVQFTWRTARGRW
jgi:hypothetical protein